MYFTKLLLLAIFFLVQVLTQSASNLPDHYYDFTKISNVNGVDYVVDQVTKDIKHSFGFHRKTFPLLESIAVRKCPAA